MALIRLRIENFRNIAHADITLSKGCNLILGANGSGKTNLLEAIYTLGHGRGFRYQQAVPALIRQSAASFTLYGCVEQANGYSHLGLYKNQQGERQIAIDNRSNATSAALAYHLPMQIVTPESMLLLTGGPKYRRAFLDWGCFHYQPTFLSIWHTVKRLLQQRNAALKQVGCYNQLKMWDQKLAPLAEQISHWRATYTMLIESEIRALCRHLLPEYQFTFYFHQGWEQGRAYYTLLEQQFKRDCQATHTLLGPHRAELQIRVDGSPIEMRLSRGQLKLLLYALRLAQGSHFIQQKQQPCLYLLDDFSAELDTRHQQLLTEWLKCMGGQILITAFHKEQIADLEIEKEKIFSIEHGKITTIA